MPFDGDREEKIDIESKEEGDGPSPIQFDQALWEVAKSNGADEIQQYVHSLGCPYPLENQTDLLYWAAQLGLVHVFIHFAEGCNLKKIAPNALYYTAQGCKIPGYIRDEESYAALWKYLVKKGFEHTKDASKFTDYQLLGKSAEMPLHCAVKHGHLEMLKKIWPSLPPLHKAAQNCLYSAAARHNHAAILAFLEEQGVQPEHFSSKDDPGGYYLAALCVAVERGHHETIEYLVGKRGAIQVGKRHDCNPLHTAAQANHHDPLIFSYLVDEGFDPRESDSSRRNTLHFLAMYGHLESIQYVQLDKKILRSRDSSGFTPLHLAASYSQLEVVSYLIKQGANPMGNSSVANASVLANEKGHQAVAAFLAPYVDYEKHMGLIEACEMAKKEEVAKEYAQHVVPLVRPFLAKEIAELVSEYAKELPKKSFFASTKKQFVKTAPNIVLDFFDTFPEKINKTLPESLLSIVSPLLVISPDAQTHITPFLGRLLAHPSLHTLQQLQQTQEKKPFWALPEENASDIEEDALDMQEESNPEEDASNIKKDALNMQKESKEESSEESLLKRKQEISECSEAFYESCGRLQARIAKAAKLSLSQSCRQEQNTLRELLLEDVSILQCTLPSGISLGKAITPKLHSLLDFLYEAKQTLISSSTLMGRASCFIAEARGQANKETQEKYLQLMEALIDASDLEPAEKESLEKQYLKGEKVVPVKTEKREPFYAMKM